MRVLILLVWIAIWICIWVNARQEHWYEGRFGDRGFGMNGNMMFGRGWNYGMNTRYNDKEGHGYDKEDRNNDSDGKDQKFSTGDLAVIQVQRELEKIQINKIQALQSDYANMRAFISRWDEENSASRISLVIQRARTTKIGFAIDIFCEQINHWFNIKT